MNQDLAGPSGSGDVVVTPQQYQAIYHEITRKVEIVAKRNHDPLIIELEDLRDLYHRVDQTLRSYNVLSISTNVTASYSNNIKDVFSDFERFVFQSNARTESTRQVSLEFNAAIRQPDDERPRPYKLTVNLNSNLGLNRRASRFPIGPSVIVEVFESIFDFSAEITIEYVDYSVAKNLMNTVDEWIAGRKCRRLPKFQSVLRKRWPIIYELSVTAMMLIVLSILVTAGSADLISFGDSQQIVVIAILIYVLLRWSKFILNDIGGRVVLSRAPCAIILNSKDRNLFQGLDKRDSRNSKKIIVSFVSLLLLNVVATISATYITKLLGV